MTTTVMPMDQQFDKIFDEMSRQKKKQQPKPPVPVDEFLDLSEEPVKKQKPPPRPQRQVTLALDGGDDDEEEEDFIIDEKAEKKERERSLREKLGEIDGDDTEPTDGEDIQDTNDEEEEEEEEDDDDDDDESDDDESDEAEKQKRAVFDLFQPKHPQEATTKKTASLSSTKTTKLVVPTTTTDKTKKSATPSPKHKPTPTLQPLTPPPSKKATPPPPPPPTTTTKPKALADTASAKSLIARSEELDKDEKLMAKRKEGLDAREAKLNEKAAKERAEIDALGKSLVQQIAEHNALEAKRTQVEQALRERARLLDEREAAQALARATTEQQVFHCAFSQMLHLQQNLRPTTMSQPEVAAHVSPQILDRAGFMSMQGRQLEIRTFTTEQSPTAVLFEIVDRQSGQALFTQNVHRDLLIGAK